MPARPPACWLCEVARPTTISSLGEVAAPTSKNWPSVRPVTKVTGVSGSPGFAGARNTRASSRAARGAPPWPPCWPPIDGRPPPPWPPMPPPGCCPGRPPMPIISGRKRSAAAGTRTAASARATSIAHLGGHAGEQLQVLVAHRDDHRVGDDVVGDLGGETDLRDSTDELAFREGVDGEAHRLRRLDLADVGLVDVAGELHAGEVLGDREQRRRLERRGDGLADVVVARHDDAVDRRADHRVALGSSRRARATPRARLPVPAPGRTPPSPSRADPRRRAPPGTAPAAASASPARRGRRRASAGAGPASGPPAPRTASGRASPAPDPSSPPR